MFVVTFFDSRLAELELDRGSRLLGRDILDSGVELGVLGCKVGELFEKVQTEEIRNFLSSGEDLVLVCATRKDANVERAMHELLDYILKEFGVLAKLALF